MKSGDETSSETAPTAWIIRRHDDRDGGHCWRGNLRESFRSGASRTHALPDPRRLGGGRLDRDVRRVYLGRACDAPARCGGRAVRVLARGLPSRRCVYVRLGPASHHANWWNGRGSSDFRVLLSRAHGSELEQQRDRRNRAADLDCGQLFWSARRQ